MYNPASSSFVKSFFLGNFTFPVGTKRAVLRAECFPERTIGKKLTFLSLRRVTRDFTWDELYKKCAQRVENRLENHVRCFPQFLLRLLITQQTLRLFRSMADYAQRYAHDLPHTVHSLQTQNQTVFWQLSPLSTSPITTTTMYINKEEIIKEHS